MPFTSPAQDKLDELNAEMERQCVLRNQRKRTHLLIEWLNDAINRSVQTCREIEAGIAIALGKTPVYTT